MKRKILLSLAIVLLSSMSLWAQQAKSLKKAKVQSATPAWSPESSSGKGTYSPTVTDALGCSAAITGPTFICYGTPANITASIAGNPNYTFVWSNTPGTSPAIPSYTGASNTQNANPTLSVTTTYTVSVTNAANCSSILSFVVTVNPQITVTATPTVSTFCANTGTGVSLTAGASGGSGTFSYAWTPTTGLTPASGIGATVTAKPGATTVYKVIVTDNSSGSCTASTTVTVNVENLTATATASPTAVCSGQCATITCTPSGAVGTPSYTWSASSGATPTSSPGATGTATVCPTVSTTYNVTVTDGNCTTTATTNIVVTPQPGATISPTALCKGAAGNVTTTYVGVNGSTTYTWSNPPGGGGPNPAIVTTTAGTFLYTVTVTNGGGCSATASAIMTINAAPTATVVCTPTAVCAGSTATISVTAAGGSGSYTYNWSAVGGAASSFPFTTGVAGTYPFTVTVTDASTGCTNTATNNLIVNPQPGVTLTPTYALCKGVVANFNPTYVGLATPTYSWTGTPGGYVNATANPVIPSGVSGTTTYVIVVTNAGGCSASASMVVTVNPTPSVVAKPTPNNPICLGQSMVLGGSPTASNGTGTYTYQWVAAPATTINTPTSANPTITPTVAGNFVFNVTVTDAAGCTGTDNVTITVNNVPTVVTTSATICPGISYSMGPNITVTGGSGSYSYLWQPNPDLNGITGANTAAPTLTNPTSTTNYTVTVTDITTGCASTAQVFIDVPAKMAIATTSTPAACGSSNGTADITGVTGGAGNPVYLWCNGQTTAHCTGLPAGTCNVTVTDQAGCFVVTPVIIGNSGAPIISPTVINNVSCNGGCDGSADFTITTGTTQPYTYKWSGGTGASGSTSTTGAPTGTVTNLCAGTYFITVTDNVGCSQQASVVITQPSAISLGFTSNNPSCNASCDGDATVSPTGGTLPYKSYVWSNGSTAATATGLCSGNFTVTVTDNNNCTQTGSVSLSSPPALNITSTFANILCNGANNGKITFTVTGGTSGPGSGGNLTPSGGFIGGTGPYTYSNLAPGTYTFSANDDKLCTKTATVTITQPATSVTYTVTVTNASCGSSNGSAALTASGGTPPYNFIFSTGFSCSAVTNCTLSNMTAGAYQATVTDANGCSLVAPTPISNAGGPTVTSTSATAVSSFGMSDGCASVTISSPNPPFTYNWSGAASTQSVTGTASTTNTACSLPAGTYTVVIIDGNGCQTNATVIIGSPTVLIVKPSYISILCNGGGTTVSSNPTGGTGTYTSYLWNNGQTTPNIVLASVTASATYSVTVTDSYPTTASGSVTVTVPSILSVNINDVGGGISCAGPPNNKTKLKAIATGGTPPYASSSYVWSGGATGVQINNVNAGTTFVTVTDANGCPASNSYTVTAPTPITFTATYVTSPTHCAGQHDLTITCGTVTGGTGTYTYLWSPSAYTTNTVTGVAYQNPYTVTVTDQNGCQATGSTGLNDGLPMSDNAVPTTTLTCFAGNNACIKATHTSGGVPPFTWTWFPGGHTQTDAGLNTNGPTSTYCSLPAGTYYAKITDNNGCTNKTNNIVIAPPPSITGTITATNVSCFNGNNGQIQATGGGGKGAPFTYTWSTGAVNTTGFLGGLTGSLAGTSYSVTISDASGCSISSNNAVAVKSIIITEPSAITTSTTATHIICNSFCTGVASVTVGVGTGTPPYTYSWSTVPGQTTQTATGLCSVFPGGTSYTVTVTDKNGCTAVNSITITEPSHVLATMSAPTNASCNGVSDGSLCVTASQGTVGTGYTYLWSNGKTTPCVTGLSGLTTPLFTTYTVTVTDGNGCQTTASGNINQPTSVTVAIAKNNDATCFGFNDGSATATGSGGSGNFFTPPAKYQWYNSGGTLIFTGATDNTLAQGTYKVIATDSKGCTGSNQIIINQPLKLSVTSISATPPTICYDASQTHFSTLKVVPAGGSGNFSYLWTGLSIPGSKTTQSINVNPTSTSTAAQTFTYTVVITDNTSTAACSTSSQVVVTVLGQLQVGAATQTPSTCPNTPVQIWANDTAGGLGGGNYRYSWTSTQPGFTPVNNSTSPYITVTPASSGTYTYTVTMNDLNNCTPATAQTTLIVYPAPTSTFTPLNASGCTPVTLNFDASGSAAQNGPSEYSWYVNGVQQAPPSAGNTAFSYTFSYDINQDKLHNGELKYMVRMKATSLPGSGAFSCSHSDSTQVTAYDIPKPGIEPDPDYTEVLDILPLARMHATHKENYPYYDTYTWDFGDPKDSTKQYNSEAYHTYPGLGTYHVNLTVTRHGCVGTVERDVIVKPKTTIWIPDAFSPNGDGVNDFFEPKGYNIMAYQIYIYDRWGALVFGSSDRSKPWDGTTSSGGPAVQDVYVYKIIITDARGTQLQPFVGKVTLIR